MHMNSFNDCGSLCSLWLALKVVLDDIFDFDFDLDLNFGFDSDSDFDFDFGAGSRLSCWALFSCSLVVYDVELECFKISITCDGSRWIWNVLSWCECVLYWNGVEAVLWNCRLATLQIDLTKWIIYAQG